MKITTRKEAKAQGLKRYFTGKPCKWGHVAERFSVDGKCAKCSRLHNRQYYAENRDKELERKRQWREENREYARQYYAENRDKAREHFRQYYAENREKKLEYFRQYRAENREKELERHRQYREENREKVRERIRQHYAENRGMYRANVTKRLAAKLERTLAHEEELTQFVMEEAAQQANDMEEVFGTPFHVDHMIPMQGRKVSGLHVWYNLQVIPAHLNISKGNRMRYTKPLEWLSDAT